MSIMRLATKPIISLRRSSSEPFSMSAFRVILSIVMVRSLGCVWKFATRANLDSDHDSFPSPAPLWTPWGKGFKGVALRSALGPPSVPRPALGSYSTPRGRQLLFSAVLGSCPPDILSNDTSFARVELQMANISLADFQPPS